MVFSVLSCNTSPPETTSVPAYSLIGGKTMGTTYSAKFKGENAEEINKALDELFLEINMEVSTYIDSSLISHFNKTEGEQKMVIPENSSGHFYENFKASQKIAEATNGLFDPTVMPLVNYWGFGYDEKRKITQIDETKVKSILEYVGYKNAIMDGGSKDRGPSFMKKHPKTELDFSAIAKGYGVDQAGKLLESKGIENYLVEIGGEVYTKGINELEKPWVIGINTPTEEAKIDDFQAYVGLSGKGMATSGNYRNYYEVDGQKFSHTINPKTGFPERSNLLSATIIANNCMTADAYATTCMVAGLEKALEIINNDNSLEGFFIFADKSGNLQTQSTEGFEKYLLD